MSKDHEDIDLNGSIPVTNSSGSVEATNSDDTSSINNIDVSYSDITDILSPSITNEELVSRVLELSEDKLIPWEECHLPSKGIYYGWPDGVVMVRAMSQVAEKILATQRLAQSGQSIDYLFRECCKFPSGFDAADLLLGDRVFLLYYLRGITHGHNYEFAVTCPHCSAVSTHVYNLNELSRTIKWAKSELGHEPFTIRLPYLSRITNRNFTVGVRFLRSFDANDILSKRKARKKMFAKPGSVKNNRQNPVNIKDQQSQMRELDDSISDNMSKIIVNVMGVTDVFVIRQFVEKMHAQDTSAIREWLKDNTPGIDNTITVQCPECSNEFTMELPITESFFRPS